MKLCIDTWFLIQLAEKEPDAIRLLSTVKSGKHSLVVPVMCVGELFSVLIRKGNILLAEKMAAQLNLIPNIFIVAIDTNISIRAAKLKHSYGLSMVDASILATAILSGADFFIAEDSDFEMVKKQNIIKIAKPKELI